jgi:hypothetical protein
VETNGEDVDDDASIREDVEYRADDTDLCTAGQRGDVVSAWRAFVESAAGGPI